MRFGESGTHRTNISLPRAYPPLPLARGRHTNLSKMTPKERGTTLGKFRSEYIVYGDFECHGENHPLLIIRSDPATRAAHMSEELDPARVWPDVASTIPVTIMVHGKCLTLPPRGTLMKLPGPWKQGWKAMTQRKAETADEFAVRCQEQIDAELVRAEPPMPSIHALPATHAARACLQARQGAAASMADSHTGHTTPESRRPPRLPGVASKLSPGSAAALAPPPLSKRSKSSGGA